MDAIKILGSLMGSNAGGGNLLGTLIKGAAGQALGGGRQPQQQSGGGLGGLASILGGLAGGSPKPAAPSGGGGIGAILGGLARQQQQAPAQPQGGGGLGGLLGGLLGGEKAPEPLPEPPCQSTQDHATILIRAMINAAKADGQIDAQEQEAIVGKLGGDLDASEQAFVQRELQAPLDVKSFAASVPRELAQHAYAFSLMGIKLDTRNEAQYLGQLAEGLGLDAQTGNAIHRKFGQPEIYS